MPDRKLHSTSITVTHSLQFVIEYTPDTKYWRVFCDAADIDATGRVERRGGVFRTGDNDLGSLKEDLGFGIVQHIFRPLEDMLEQNEWEKDTYHLYHEDTLHTTFKAPNLREVVRQANTYIKEHKTVNSGNWTLRLDGDPVELFISETERKEEEEEKALHTYQLFHKDCWKMDIPACNIKAALPIARAYIGDNIIEEDEWTLQLLGDTVCVISPD